jgi:hypothetical protein
MDNSNSIKTATNSENSGSLFNSFFSSQKSSPFEPANSFNLGSTPSSLYSSSSESSSWVIYLVIGLVTISILGALGYYYYLEKNGKVPPMLQAGQAYFSGIVNKIQASTTAIPGATASPAMTQSAEVVDNEQQYKDELEQQQNQLNETLNSAKPEVPQKIELGYEADDSSSSIQASKSSSKSGWCYIGEDRGFRSCIQVGQNDTCMSGDIFPSQDICVNPSLRQ